MGARTDFVRAMLIGVVIGIALTVAFFQLRGEATISSAGSAGSGSSAGSSTSTQVKPGSAVSPVSPVSNDARLAEIAQLRARIAELEKTDAPARFEPDADSGMSTSDEWWAKLPANPAWDAPRKDKVIDRLKKQVGVALDPKHVECKRRCCRIYLDDATYEEHLDDITSAVGLDFEPPDGWGTSMSGDGFVLTKCWSMKPPEMAMPDRAAERDALLAKAAGDLAKCGANVTPVITLVLQLHVDDAGQIERVESNAKQLGQKAASCAEAAILQAASFAAAPSTTRVPIRVPLGK
jgi:hypothetical protein